MLASLVSFAVAEPMAITLRVRSGTNIRVRPTEACGKIPRGGMVDFRSVRKVVRVTGTSLEDAALRAAIDAAGYEAE